MSPHFQGTLEDSGEAAEPPTAEPRARRLLPGIRLPSSGEPLVRAVWVAIVLAVLCLAAAAWFLVSWHSTATDRALARGRTRELLLEKTSQVAVTLNTEDAAHAKHTVATWRDATAGPLHEKYAKAGEKYEKAIASSGNISDATVTEEAVRALNADSGVAEVLVSIDVTVHKGKKDKTKHERLTYDMTRTPDGWKAKAMHTLGGA
jgi:Mce-associated membrane protein